MEILDQKVITAAEAKALLEARDIDQMTYEQRICLDFLKKNLRMSSEDGKQMFDDLKELGIDDDIAASIINTNPKSVEEIKMIFPKERLAPKDEELEKINEIVRKHE